MVEDNERWTLCSSVHLFLEGRRREPFGVEYCIYRIAL